MDFSTSATVLLCSHNPMLVARWHEIERAALSVISTADSQVALERVLLDPQLWLLVIDSQWEAGQAQRLLQWLQRSPDERVRNLPVLIVADSLASSEWVPILADPVHAVWRSAGAERIVRQLFEQAAASGRLHTEVMLEWQGESRPRLPGAPLPDGPAPAPGLLRAGDRWLQRSATQWTLRLDGNQADVLAPLLRLSGQIRAAAKDDAETPTTAATGYLVAHLHGTTYRLPGGRG